MWPSRLLTLFASLSTFDRKLPSETTDTDESEFRPAKAARDGVDYIADVIPDGFYLVDNVNARQPAWHAAMIEAVAKVTHIAPPDVHGNIIGEPVGMVWVCSIAASHERRGLTRTRW